MNYISEIKEHLNNNRFKLALILAKKFYEEQPENPDSLILYSKSLIENFNPFLAIQVANEAVDLFKKNPEVFINRAEILYRMSIFSGALFDIETYLNLTKDLNSKILKAKILSGLENFQQAAVELKDIKLNSEEFKKLYEAIILCDKIVDRNKIYIKEIEKLLEIAESFKKNENFWIPIWLAKNFLNKIKDEKLKNKVKLLEFYSLVDSFRIKEAELKLKYFELNQTDNEIFQQAVRKLNTIIKFKQSSESISDFFDDENLKIQNITNKPIQLLSIRFFNLGENILSGKRKYLLQFDESNLDYVAVEVLIKNPYFKIETKEIKGLCIWYLNDIECGRHKFDLKLNKDWEIIEVVQSWGNEQFKFWKVGVGKLEMFFDEQLILSKQFSIDEYEIINTEELPSSSAFTSFNKQQTKQPNEIEQIKSKEIQHDSLKYLIDQLHSFIGLDSLKNSLTDFITYLNFISERKKRGIKTEEQLELHCIFLGNPGTGKTTIARLLGNIFKAMGILENGHVVEVDRSGLVGQYIGETAVKTDKMINDAMGGILFIDEAYTLKKPGTSNDFGQEAIDILLKRMEDLRGKFVVIAAGYPGPMKDFIESNPGLKSRFTHTFIFEDYSPEQLTKIYKFFAKKEEYSLTDDAEIFLTEKFKESFENRDETFGNARLARKIFNETKIQIGKRFQSVPDSEKANFSLNLITIEDIQSAFGIISSVKDKKLFEQDQINVFLNKVNSLLGFSDFKKELNEIAKLAKYYSEEGADINQIFNYHFIFSGKSGTGKTTGAKLLTEFLFILGLIKKNHFLEIEHLSLIGNNIEQTLDKLSRIFDRASNGLLMIKNFDMLFDILKYRTDIYNEFIEHFRKKISCHSEKLIVVADVNYDFLYHYPKEFTSLKPLFNKVISFDDFNSIELLALIRNLLMEKKLTLTDDSEKLLFNFIENIVIHKEQYPQNYHLVKYIVEAIQRKHLLQLSDLQKEQRTEEITTTISTEVIKDILDSQIIYQNQFQTSTSNSLKKYLEDLHRLVGIQQIKDSIQNIINSEKLNTIRRERGLNVIPKNYNCLFIGNRYTGKSTVARIYAGILKELCILQSPNIIEIDTLSISDYFNEKNLTNLFEGKLLLINDVSSLTHSNDILLRETIARILSTIKDQKDKFVTVISDNQKGINTVLNKHPELKIIFVHEFIFNDFSPREMLEITFTITQQYGYQLDEGAWQLLLEIFSDVVKKNDTNFLNTKAIFELIYRMIKNQEERISKENITSDIDLITIRFDDVKNIYNLKE